MFRILRLPQVEDRVGLKKSAIYKRVKLGEFPRPVPLGTRAVGWPDHEIDQLISAQIAGATEKEIRRLVDEMMAKRTGRFGSDD